jgi:hypothetical protein
MRESFNRTVGEKDRVLASVPSRRLLYGGIFVTVCLLIGAWTVYGHRRVFRRPNTQLHLVTSDSASNKKLAAQTPVVLSSEALAHGRKQLVQMLKDRPGMQRYIQPDDPVWTWCVRQFAGEGVGEPVWWHNEPPTGENIECDCLPPSENHQGFIRIRQTYSRGTWKDQNRRGEEFWADAVYELNNLQNSKPFLALDEAAWKGTINKQAWIRGILKLEYGTMKRSALVYKTLWKPCIHARGIRTYPYIYRWGLFIPDTFEEYIAEFDITGPFVDHTTENYYSKAYDEKFAPHVRSLRARQNERSTDELHQADRNERH